MEKIEQTREEERGNENFRKLQIQKKTRGVITKDQRGVRYNGSVLVPYKNYNYQKIN